MEKRHLKLPEVDKLLLAGCVLWKWEDVSFSRERESEIESERESYFVFFVHSSVYTRHTIHRDGLVVQRKPRLHV